MEAPTRQGEEGCDKSRNPGAQGDTKLGRGFSRVAGGRRIPSLGSPLSRLCRSNLQAEWTEGGEASTLCLAQGHGAFLEART